MKQIFKILSFIVIIATICLISSCVESAPSTNEYTVTFKDYDGTILKEEVVQEGHEATAPNDPIRDGYIFIGWSDEYTNVKKNTICIAQYEKQNEIIFDKYTVTFDSNGGTIIESQQVEKGNNVVEPVNPTKEGYTFIGWYLNDEKWSFIGYTVTKNITLVAKWNINTYEITYDLNNGIVTNPTTYIVEDKITLNNPTKEHYEFIGWTSDTIQEPQLNVEINNETGNKHFVANYKPITYTISFNEDGGSEVEDIEFTIETNNIELPTPTRDGYDFLGWYENDVLVTEFEIRDYNLVAKWEEIEETNIKVYEENGQLYVNLGRYPQTVVTDETIINALSNITEENVFGYIEYNGNEYKKVVADTYQSNYTFINGNTITEGNTYYFLVEPIKWKVLEENDGTYKLLSEMIIDNTNFYHTDDQNRTINGETIYPNNYEYSNIRAWLNGYDGSSYNVDNYTRTGFYDIAFTEKEKQLINTTLVDNGLSSTRNTSNSYICNNTNDKVYLLSVSDTLNTNYGFSSDYTEYDVARRAQVSDYARSKYCYMDTVTSYYGNGTWWLRSPHNRFSINACVVFAYGCVDNRSNYVNYSDSGVRPALTITLDKDDYYQVSFKDYNDKILKTDYVKKGESATAPTPSREHYNFIGWDKEFTNIQGDLEVKALYEAITYTITFDSDGGNSIEDIEYTIETNKIELPTPIHDGYDFLGWYENDILIKELEYRDYNLVAKWEEIEEEVDIKVYEENGYTYINLGRYPQTVVTEETIINALSNISTTNSLGYIEYNGNEYKKVVANPLYSDYTFINGNTITEGNTYYFLVEPIKWRVLEEKDGTYKLLSEMIIDNTVFYDSSSSRTINGQTIYANNYEYSNVRAWLNGYDGTSYNVDNYTGTGFYDIAFTEEEKQLINTTLVDNSLSSTGDTSNSYICNNTNDKVYLLSRSDTLNTNYGFSSDYLELDVVRRGQVSDYARSKYCIMDNSIACYGSGEWWLRSPYNGISYGAQLCSARGAVGNGYRSVKSVFSNVRPALTILLNLSDYYQVSFKDYNDKILKTDYVKKGKSAIAPTPKREYYNFIGWDKEFTNIQGDLEVKALYEAITYTISFDSNGGNQIEDIKYTIEANNIELLTPTRDGYDFLGWYENDALVTEFGIRDYNLVAKWEEIEEESNIDIYEENEYKYINLGRYPQTVVIDENIINALSNISTTNEFGYIEYNGNEYKKVVADTSESNYTFINGNTIVEGTTYYFLVEPIKWRVLKERNKTYILLSEKIIDNTSFYYTSSTHGRTINGKIICSNNYEYSNIRAWLNGYDGTSYNVDNYTGTGFYDIAFTEEEKQLINTTLVDNSLSSTGDTSNSYICNNTNDKVYLLSVSNTLNTNYGFSSVYYVSDVARRAQVSDYARSKYCYMDMSTSYYGNGDWWLRSPDNYDYNCANMVISLGCVRDRYGVHSTDSGVRPALTITI